jgi:hypothetical protein
MTHARLFRSLALAGLVAGLGLSGLATPAAAAGNHPAAASGNHPAATAGNHAAPTTSNAGGDVRGTARADERAGDHGDQGRDRAEANKTKTKGKPAKDVK